MDDNNIEVCSQRLCVYFVRPPQGLLDFAGDNSGRERYPIFVRQRPALGHQDASGVAMIAGGFIDPDSVINRLSNKFSECGLRHEVIDMAPENWETRGVPHHAGVDRVVTFVFSPNGG